MLKQYLSNRTKGFQYINAALVVLIVAGIGTYILTSSHASTPYVSTTADSGTLASGATKQTCSGATSGNCVVFGGSSTSSQVVSFNNILFDSPLSNPSEYQFVEVSLSSVQNGVISISQLHAENPNLKVLLYQNVQRQLQVYPTGSEGQGCTAYNPNDPSSWYTTDSASNRLIVTDDGGNTYYLMNQTDPSYQQACAKQVVSLAKQYGFDGVFFDELSWYGYHNWLDQVTGKPASPTQNADPTDWFNGIVALSNVLGPALKNNGLISIANITDYPGGVSSQETPDTSGVARLVGPLNGYMEESWTDGGLGLSQQVPFWPHKFANAQWASENNKYDLLHSYNTTESGNTFGLGAILLVSNGNASYTTDNTEVGSQATWYPEYSLAQNLGKPLGTYTQSGSIYIRNFTNGIVVVNPTNNTVNNVSLGGTYSGTGNEPTSVNSVNLGPTTGYILLK